MQDGDESELGQVIYSWRGISVEPLIEQIKGLFKIDPLPIRGYQKAADIVPLSVLLYQILVYYNCNTCKEHPKAIHPAFEEEGRSHVAIKKCCSYYLN
jgi:hypothetical protein